MLYILDITLYKNVSAISSYYTPRILSSKITQPVHIKEYKRMYLKHVIVDNVGYCYIYCY